MRDLFHSAHRPHSESGPKRRRTTRRGRSRKAGQGIESLEPIARLSTTCPMISGYVFLDESATNPGLTDNGLLDPGETPIASAPIVLLDSSNRPVGTTTTDANGAYSFGGTVPDAPTAAPSTVVKTITIGDPDHPDVPTNFTNQTFSPALPLFDPSLGTLKSVKISSDVFYNSNITVTNFSLVSPASGITAELDGSYHIQGLGPSLALSGNPTKSGTGMDLPPYRVTPAGVPTDTIDLSVHDQKDSVLTSAEDLAFFSASSGQAAITPTIVGPRGWQRLGE